MLGGRDGHQPELIATAAGEAAPLVAHQVDAHVAACPRCRQSYERCRDIERLVGELKRMPAPEGRLAILRQLPSRPQPAAV